MKTPNQERYRLERNQQVQDRRQHIISTAREIFSTNGIENTTMLELAEAAHISKMTLYRYFPDRPTVAIEVAIDTIHQIRARITQQMTLTPTSQNQLQNMFVAMIDAFPELEKEFRFMAMFDSLYYSSYPTPELQQRYQAEVQNIFGRSLDTLITTLEGREKFTKIITTANMITSYLQRLALRGELMSNEQMVPIEIQLQYFRKIVVNITNDLF